MFFTVFLEYLFPNRSLKNPLLKVECWVCPSPKAPSPLWAIAFSPRCTCQMGASTPPSSPTVRISPLFSGAHRAGGPSQLNNNRKPPNGRRLPNWWVWLGVGGNLSHWACVFESLSPAFKKRDLRNGNVFGGLKFGPVFCFEGCWIRTEYFLQCDFHKRGCKLHLHFFCFTNLVNLHLCVIGILLQGKTL